MKKHFLALSLSLSCLSVTGSVAAADAGSVRVVDQNSVASCTFLTSITESKYSGILFAAKGLRKAQAKVLASAARAGASHVVWISLNSGGVYQTATASAYRCPK